MKIISALAVMIVAGLAMPAVQADVTANGPVVYGVSIDFSKTDCGKIEKWMVDNNAKAATVAAEVHIKFGGRETFMNCADFVQRIFGDMPDPTAP